MTTEPAEPLGPIGDEILFENDTVRVWGLTLEPGALQDWHRHDLPYLIVPLTDGNNEMTFSDGRTRMTTEVAGRVIWREAGIPHKLCNRSTWRYRNVLIELKRPAVDIGQQA